MSKNSAFSQQVLEDWLRLPEKQELFAGLELALTLAELLAPPIIGVFYRIRRIWKNLPKCFRIQYIANPLNLDFICTSTNILEDMINEEHVNKVDYTFHNAISISEVR